MEWPPGGDQDVLNSFFRPLVLAICVLQPKFINMKPELISARSLVGPSSAPGSRTSSTANRRAAGSSCRSDGSAVQPNLRVTSCHRRPPSPATASHPGPRLQPAPPACGRSSRRSGSRRRCRSAAPSRPGRRPSPDPDLLLLLWAGECSVDTVDTGSTPGGGKGG